MWAELSWRFSWLDERAALVGALLAATLFLAGFFLTARRAPGRRTTLRRTRIAEAIPAPLRRRAPVAVRIADETVSREPTCGRVVDRNVDGLCIEVDGEATLGLGTVLSVRAIDAPEAIPWVKVRVTAWRRAPGGWEMDCPYVRTPPWNVRMLFG